MKHKYAKTVKVKGSDLKYKSAPVLLRAQLAQVCSNEKSLSFQSSRDGKMSKEI